MNKVLGVKNLVNIIFDYLETYELIQMSRLNKFYHFLWKQYITKLDLSNKKYDDSTVELFCERSFLNLIDLNLSHNLISDIEFLHEFTKLEILNLSYNKIENFAVCQNFKLQQLKSLNLSNNKILSIAYLTNICSKLEILNLSHNQLTFKKYYINQKEFPYLINIDLSYNYIEDLNCIKYLNKVKIINLSHNKISKYTLIKDSEPNEPLNILEEINLSFNIIKDIKILSYLKMNNLKKINLGKNNIIEIKKIENELFVKTLEELNIYGNQIVDFLHLDGFVKLKKLNISWNKIQIDNTNLFKQETLDILKENNLIELDITGNNIKEYYSINKNDIKKIVKNFYFDDTFKGPLH